MYDCMCNSCACISLYPAIDTVSGVTIKCNPLTFIVQCTTEWNVRMLMECTYVRMLV